MDAIQHLKELIHFDSVSSKSNVPITDHIERLLKQRGCEVERLEYDDKLGVRKASVVAKLGPGTGGMAYFGHTDVVPASPWFTDQHGPFEPTIKEGKLYGRGSCDMKGSVAWRSQRLSGFESRTSNVQYISPVRRTKRSVTEVLNPLRSDQRYFER